LDLSPFWRRRAPKKLICPPYQSSFIYDKETLRKKFSYFKEDSTPKILTASKNKIPHRRTESYRKKMRGLKTVEMKPVYPVIPDSLKLNKGEDLILAERDVIDSTAPRYKDSVYTITKTKEKYNVDQDIYMGTSVTVSVARRSRGNGNTERNKAKATKTKKKKGNFFRN